MESASIDRMLGKILDEVFQGEISTLTDEEWTMENRDERISSTTKIGKRAGELATRYIQTALQTPVQWDGKEWSYLSLYLYQGIVYAQIDELRELLNIYALSTPVEKASSVTDYEWLDKEIQTRLEVYNQIHEVLVLNPVPFSASQEL
jgi:hypothetical protein